MSDPEAPLLLTQFEQSLVDIEGTLKEVVRATATAVPQRHALLVQQADWHASGVLYHFRAIYDHYRSIASGVSSRTAENPVMIVMYSPETQALLFEFYALVTLCRITLDQLKTFVAPTFATNPANLPNSVTDMQKGKTDCPLYASYLVEQSVLLRYLLDVRDCVVHHRPFASSDNTVAILEGAEIPPQMFPPWHEAVTRVTFRHVGSNGISVNVLLPDAIWEYDAEGNRRRMVRHFAYQERINLLSQCREFTWLTVGAVVTALTLLQAHPEPVYVWER